MKKILAVIAVLAITLISSVALAEVAVSGSIDTRGRAFNNLDNNKDVADYNRDTQTRVRLNFDGKAGDAKAKVTIEKDFETWGDVEVTNKVFSDLREAWVLTPLVGPVNLKAGHVLAQLGNGWFFRSMKYGFDAGIIYADIGPIHVGFVDGKITDVLKDRDLDMYVGVVSAKLSDTMTVGMDLSQVNLARASVDTVTGANVLHNLGVNANLGLGPVKLKAELDLQKGRDNAGCVATVGCPEYKGNQLVIEGSMAAGPANINFTVARGSGDDTPPAVGPANIDHKQFATILDADPHYTLLYEYRMTTATGGVHTGFANTTAISAGADMKIGPVVVGGNIWWLSATEDTNLRGATDALGAPVYESDLGIEIDARVNWKINDAVSLNTTLGYFIPGDAYMRDGIVAGSHLDADETTGIQSVLSMKF